MYAYVPKPNFLTQLASQPTQTAQPAAQPAWGRQSTGGGRPGTPDPGTYMYIGKLLWVLYIHVYMCMFFALEIPFLTINVLAVYIKLVNRVI